MSLLLDLLARQGVREVLINLHHLPETIRRAVAQDHPAALDVTWSDEEKPLGTGGGLRRAAEFLRQSETCLVMAGDMLLDLDLLALKRAHRESGRDVTLVLRRDAREASFGSVGVDEVGDVCRIGRHPLVRGETTAASASSAAPGSAPGSVPGSTPGSAPERARGLFTGVRFFERDALRDWPADEVFEDLRDWLMPRAARGDIRLGAEIDASPTNVWEPVGTPDEYLEVNLRPPILPRLGGAAEAWSGAVDVVGEGKDVVAARSVRIPADARLARCVVWDDARIAAGTRAQDGVFGARGFHAFGSAAADGADQRGAA